MIRILTDKVQNMYISSESQVPEQYREEFLQEVVKINTARDKILAAALIIIDAILLYVDFFVDRALERNETFAMGFMIIHILLLFIAVSFLLFDYIKTGWQFANNDLLERAIHITLNLSVLILCSLLGANAILSKGQPFSYVISIFCMASVVLFNTTERSFIYITSFLFYITLLLSIPADPVYLFWNIFFITILNILAFIVSGINFSYYAGSFVSRKTILQKNEELDYMYKNIEETLKERTRELIEANEQLINEINAKHEMEMQVIKTRSICEEKERLLNETLELEKVRTIFFANISHELRTPLTVIFSAQQMLDLMLKNIFVQGEDKEINHYMKMIKQNCYRLIRLIANLIDITKIDAGYFQVNFKNCNIVNIVEEITLSVAGFIEGKEIRLIFDTEMEEKITACDPDKIERIILNLLSNAVKFTPKGGEISVSMTEGDDSIIISVKDTGIGIPHEMQEMIFDRFVQVENTTVKNREGSGIGLSLVKSLVEMHMGTIKCISEWGKGSEFIIEIPCRIVENSDEVDNKRLDLDDNKNIERINIEFSDIYF